MKNFSDGPYDVCVIGGAGHVGAPLSILMAARGLRTLVYDVNQQAMDQLAAGRLPYFEEDGELMLQVALADRKLAFTTDPAQIKQIPYIIIAIGTPVDEFHNPVVHVLTDCIDVLLPYLGQSQTIVLRSTVFPGITDYLQRYLRSHGRQTRVAFCPERVVQGQAIKEMQTLPQIISGSTPEAEEAAARLFARIAPKIVRLRPMEAEFAKLICNAYRYIQFAATNQFYMMTESAGLSYARIMEGLKEDYPRMRDLPRAGLAAGPCLYKDTLQLAAFCNNQFALGQSAIQVNEGLPAYLTTRLNASYPLEHMTVGLLGMAFKADSDDPRASLSYKLKKLLRIHARRVLTTDPFVQGDRDLLPLAEVIEESDLLILCTPHSLYRAVDLKGKPVVDIWNFLKPAPKSDKGPEPILEPTCGSPSK